MDNTDYEEEREVNIIANRKLKGSVMNIALPTNAEENRASPSKASHLKRRRSEIDDQSRPASKRDHLHENIKNAFNNHLNQGNDLRSNKRVKTAENDEREFSKGNDDEYNITTSFQKDIDNKKQEEKDGRQRTLSISNFEPVLPRSKMINCKINLLQIHIILIYLSKPYLL